MGRLSIDVLTIMVVLSIFNFVATAFMVIYTRLTGNRGALALFILGKLAQALSWAFRVAVYIGAPAWANLPADFLIIAGFALESALFLAFRKHLDRRAIILFATSFTAFAAIAAFLRARGVDLANLVVLLAYLLYMSVAAVRLIAARLGTPFQRILGLVYGTFPLASSVLYVLVYDEVTTPGVSTTPVGLLYYFMIWTMQIVGSVGYLLMVKERDEISLAEIASTDALTGILNRRAFYERAEVLVANATRSREDMTVMSLDLDRFKLVNDRWGHQAGDRVIVRFCDLVARAVRKGDLFARHGGEEFIILLPHCTRQEALVVASRIRDSLAKNGESPVHGEPTPSCTASIGLATGAPAGTADLDRLVARSDKALYASKRAGRDRVSWTSLEPEASGDDEPEVVLGPSR